MTRYCTLLCDLYQLEISSWAICVMRCAVSVSNISLMSCVLLQGATIAMVAAGSGQVECLRVCVQMHCNLDLKDKKVQTTQNKEHIFHFNTQSVHGLVLRHRDMMR